MLRCWNNSYPKPITFYRNDELFAAYKSLTKSPVILSLHSTLGLEAMVLGKRVMYFYLAISLFVKISSSLHENDFELWPWIVFDQSYEKFENLFNQLLSLDKEEYVFMTKSKIKYLIGSDTDELANKKIIKRY